ncbi:hypothetical protein GAMM_270001 [Gammaproteobacteria bacterium]
MNQLAPKILQNEKNGRNENIEQHKINEIRGKNV